jgi:hypothetical protein
MQRVAAMAVGVVTAAPRAARRAMRMLAAAALVAGCVGLVSPGSGGPVAEAPAYRVGDRWVYKAKDGFRSPVTWDETREVIAIGADGITVRVSQRGEVVDNTFTEVWAAPGQVRVGTLFVGETRRFALPLQRENFPLVPGKAWNQRVDNYNEYTKKEGQINRYVRVGGWKTVTTPAGTFEAIQMRVIMRLDDEEFWRWGTDCNYLVSWAPAVRGMVEEEKEAQYYEKGGPYDNGAAIRSQHATLELVSFTPGK